MTVEDVAAYLKKSPGTIRNWISQKIIPHYKVTRGTVLFRRSMIDNWLKGREFRPRNSRAPAPGAKTS